MRQTSDSTTLNNRREDKGEREHEKKQPPDERKRENRTRTHAFDTYAILLPNPVAASLYCCSCVQESQSCVQRLLGGKRRCCCSLLAGVAALAELPRRSVERSSACAETMCCGGSGSDRMEEVHCSAVSRPLCRRNFPPVLRQARRSTGQAARGVDMRCIQFRSALDLIVTYCT